jgi:hypothetical protein
VYVGLVKPRHLNLCCGVGFGGQCYSFGAF